MLRIPYHELTNERDARLHLAWARREAALLWRAFARYRSPIHRDAAEHYDRQAAYWQAHVERYGGEREER